MTTTVVKLLTPFVFEEICGFLLVCLQNVQQVTGQKYSLSDEGKLLTLLEYAAQAWHRCS